MDRKSAIEMSLKNEQTATVEPASQTANGQLFYEPPSEAGRYASILPEDDGMIRSEVLPGFQFRIADLYRLPSWIELAGDPVYRHFVLLEYQAVQAFAGQEHQRAERLAARLRSLGISEEQL